MSWNEIARVLLTGEPSSEAVTREAARLRKRFQLVKDDLRARAREVGLISEDDT
jgi:RNA polymerase sigma-70 factor, ECF subfamily